MSVFEYCDDDVGAIQNEACPNDPDGIGAVHLIEDEIFDSLDLENANDWDTNQANGKIKSFYLTRGTYTGPEWEEGDGFGFVATTKTGAQHTLEYQWRGVNSKDGSDNFINQDSLNEIALAEGKYRVVWIGGDKKGKYSGFPVDVQPQDPQTADLKAQQFYNIMVKWDQRGLVSKFDPPPVAYTLYSI